MREKAGNSKRETVARPINEKTSATRLDKDSGGVDLNFQHLRQGSAGQLAPAQVLMLQRTLGNQRVQRMLASSTPTNVSPMSRPTIQRSIDVSDVIDWDSAKRCRRLGETNNPVICFDFAKGDKVVVKFQGVKSSISESYLNTLAKGLGFVTANSRIIASGSTEAQACVDVMRSNKELAAIVANYERDVYGSLLVMDFLPGADLGDKGSDDLLETKGRFEEMGRLMAFQVFSSGNDRFALPRGLGNLNKGNIRFDGGSNKFQAIDNSITTTRMDGSKHVDMQDNVNDFTEHYQKLLDPVLNNLILSKRGKDDISATMISSISDKGKKNKKERQQRKALQQGFKHGIKDMATLGLDFRDLTSTARDHVPKKALQPSEKYISDVNKQNIPETMKKQLIDDTSTENLGVLRNDNIALFFEQMKSYFADKAAFIDEVEDARKDTNSKENAVADILSAATDMQLGKKLRHNQIATLTEHVAERSVLTAKVKGKKATTHKAGIKKLFNVKKPLRPNKNIIDAPDAATALDTIIDVGRAFLQNPSDTEFRDFGRRAAKILLRLNTATIQ